MKKMLLAALMVMGTTAALTSVVTPAQAAAPAAAPGRLVCDNTRDDPYTGTYSSVRVPKGASCYLEDALVTGNLKALHGAVDVLVINTEVQRNIHIRGASRDVKIGPRGCGFDPPVGNNIKVTDSHNVAICWMTVDNNIMVSRNDGRLMLRNNVVGASIRVVDNLPYNRQPGDGRHKRIGAVRLRDNTAARHIVVQRNDGRRLLLRRNTPEPTT